MRVAEAFSFCASLFFINSSLSIDYIQDTHFINVTCVRSGSTASAPIVNITNNSNYLYFLDCHIEFGNYLLRSSGGAWEVHFTNCHIESGDYGGSLGPSFEKRYSSSPFTCVGSEYNWYFTNCTFVPVSVDALVSFNGGSRSSQPVYVTGNSNNSFFSFIGCFWIAPSNAINPIYFTGDFTNHLMNNCSFKSINPITSSIIFGMCTVTSCNFNFYEGWNSSTLYGVTVNRGIISNCTFGNSAGGTTKSTGYLIYSSTNNILFISNNQYNMGTTPYGWANQYVNTSGETNALGNYTYTTSGAINMELVPLGYTLYTTTSGLTITSMTNCQRGRSVKIFNNSGSGTVNFVNGIVYPKTANNLTMAGYSQYLFVADINGQLIQITS